MAKLLMDIEVFTGIINGADTIRWRHNNDGFFSVIRMYKRDDRVACVGKPIPWKNIWESIIPPKVNALLGWWLEEHVSPRRSSRKKASPLCPDDFYVWKLEKQIVTYSFILDSQLKYGQCSSTSQKSSVQCLNTLLIY